MGAAAVAAFGIASFVIDNLPKWIGTVENVYELYVHTRAVIDANKGPGQDDWNSLDDRAVALEARVNDTSKDA